MRFKKGFKRVIFFPDYTIKTHVIHNSVLDIALADIKQRHGAIPVEVHDLDLLKIDPGGMIKIDAVPLELTINNEVIRVNPEHINFSLYRWSRPREFGGVTKVYMSHSQCIVVSARMYAQIGAWLAGNKGAGFAARMEMATALKGIVHTDMQAEERVYFPNKSDKIH